MDEQPTPQGNALIIGILIAAILASSAHHCVTTWRDALREKKSTMTLTNNATVEDALSGTGFVTVR